MRSLVYQRIVTRSLIALGLLTTAAMVLPLGPARSLPFPEVGTYNLNLKATTGLP